MTFDRKQTRCFSTPLRCRGDSLYALIAPFARMTLILISDTHFFVQESTMSTTLQCYMLGTHRNLPSELIHLVIGVFNECMDEYGYWDGISSCLNCGFILKWAHNSTITQVLTSWNPWQQSSSPSPGIRTLAAYLNNSRRSRGLPAVTCLSAFRPRARMVPVAKFEDTPASQIDKRGLTSLAPLAMPPPPPT